MPEIVTSFQPFENPKKPLKIMAHCDIAPRFLPTKIREEPLFEGMETLCEQTEPRLEVWPKLNRTFEVTRITS
jgi:hypothetical protein